MIKKFKNGNKVIVTGIVRKHDVGVRYLGQIGEINGKAQERGYDHMILFKDGWNGMFSEKELTRVLKTPSPKYMLFYELNGVDPIATFTSKEFLMDWLKLARNNHEISFDSIRVFEVVKEHQIETEIVLK